MQHFDAEYAALCVKLAAKLARKRPSPLAAVTAGSGRPASCTRSGGSLPRRPEPQAPSAHR
ncbi:hypothetical protein [Actinophytocola sp.]|uniref:hypothetical protein n=1 Tax=Actinophytocola sp. TaxID=1872138 RepID=UPI0039C8BCEC